MTAEGRPAHPTGNERLRSAWTVAVVCVALAFIAAAWSETFAPLARQSDGYFATPDGAGRYVIRQIAPRYAHDPHGPRVGDIVDLRQRTWIDRARLNNGAERDGMEMTVQRGRSTAQVSVTLAPNDRGVEPQTVATGIEATVAIVIFAFLFLRRPSVATAALFYYGCASIDISPVLRQLGALPDPAFAVAAFFLLVGFYELPSFALLLFLTRFPAVPSTRAARLRMHAGDAIAGAAAVACAALALSDPIIVGVFHTVLLALGTLLGLVFAVLGYRDAGGESRQRIGWVIVGLVVSDVAYLVYTLVVSYLTLGPELQWLEVAMNLVTLALPISLAYAVWRHHVLDVGFALNRAAVFTTTSAILVGIFGGLQWAANALVVRATHPQSFFIQLAIACVILYVFRIARTSIEALVSHTLFAGRRRRIEWIGAIADEVDALSDAGEVAQVVEQRLAAIGISAALIFADNVPSAGFGAEQVRRFELRVRGRVRGVLVVTPSPSEGDLAPDEAAALQALALRVLIARDDMLAEELSRDLVAQGSR